MNNLTFFRYLSVSLAPAFSRMPRIFDKLKLGFRPETPSNQVVGYGQLMRRGGKVFEITISYDTTLPVYDPMSLLDGADDFSTVYFLGSLQVINRRTVIVLKKCFKVH